MQKLLLPLLLLSLGAQAQISITSSDYNQPQDTSVSYGSTATSIPLGTAGGGNTWDFSSLALTDAAYSTSWVPNVNTPGYSDFPNANVVSTGLLLGQGGQIESDSSYGFMTSTSSYADLLGSYRGDKTSYQYKLVYTKPQRILQYPFNYQNVMTYDAAAVQYVGGLGKYLDRDIEGTLTYDAYGKITFPGSTIPVDGSRVKKIETLKDSSTMALGSIVGLTTIETSFVQYTFFSKDKRNLSIIYSTITTSTSYVGFPLPPTTSTRMDTSVIFTKPATKRLIVSSLDSEYENSGVYKLFPSVTSGKITVADPSKVTAVSIHSINGEEQRAPQDFNNLAIEGRPGLYVVKVSYITGKQKSFKVIKQ